MKELGAMSDPESYDMLYDLQITSSMLQQEKKDKEKY